jgi:hypothetical protein
MGRKDFDVGKMFRGHVIEARLGPNTEIREIALTG